MLTNQISKTFNIENKVSLTVVINSCRSTYIIFNNKNEILNQIQRAKIC